MGKGAFVTMTNRRTTEIDTYPSEYHCVFTNGDEGSTPERLQIDNFLPDRPSERVYIEAKSSPPCHTETRRIKIAFRDAKGEFAHLWLCLNGHEWRVDASNDTIESAIEWGYPDSIWIFIVMGSSDTGRHHASQTDGPSALQFP